jgi:hypothetical protein
MSLRQHYIRGLFFDSYEQASMHFGVDIAYAQKQIARGVPIDMAFGDRPALKKEEEGKSNFHKFIKPAPKRLVPEIIVYKEYTVPTKSQVKAPELTFKSLRQQHPYYSKRLNTLHAFIDSNASELRSSLAVVNGKAKMLEDIKAVIKGRWQKLKGDKSLFDVDINEIQDVSYNDYSPYYHGVIAGNTLNNARIYDITLVYVPGGLIPSRIQSSLANLLRRRINLNLPTVILTDKNFLSSLEEYDRYLDESLLEYKNEFVYIDVNPAKVL